MKKIYALLLSGLLFASCEKGEEDPSFISMTDPVINLKYDDFHTYGYIAKEGVATTWKSSDEKVGTVSDAGRFKARKIGQTTVSLTIDGKTKESKVTVSPYMTFLAEPVLEFGSTVDNVKSKEKRKLSTETDELLVYEGENSKVRLVSYYKQNGKVSSSLVLFQNSTSVVPEVTTFLKERYPDNSLIENSAVHLSDDRKYGVTLSVHNSLGLNAIYAPYKTNGRKSEIDSQIKHINALVQTVDK